jgi:hypothetical protein
MKALRTAGAGQPLAKARVSSSAARPAVAGRQGFYNRRVAFSSSQIDGQLVWWKTSGHGPGNLGFSQIGVAGVDLSSAEPGLSAWLARGSMVTWHYMAATA